MVILLLHMEIVLFFFLFFSVSDLHFFRVPAALNKSSSGLWRAQPSCRRLPSWCISLLPLSSHSSRYSTHIFQTCLRPRSSQGFDTNSISATGKLCCWMTQFLDSHILHSQWFTVFASKKKYQGIMSSMPFAKDVG